MSCFLHRLQMTNVTYVLLFAVHLASALIKWGMLMWNNGSTSQGPSYNVAVKSWKTWDGTICVTSREEVLSCGWSLCVHEHGQRATEMLPQFLNMYRTASNSQTSVFGLLTLHACSDKSGCGLCAGVTTVVSLHRPLSAQSHSVTHSTFVPCNSTAHVLFPVTVLQLTQIPPSSTDCLQIQQRWPTITNHPYGMSLTCKCSLYRTLPRSVCILLQINILAFFR